jgi:hypothetical protein
MAAASAEGDSSIGSDAIEPPRGTRVMYKGKDITNEACILEDILAERKALRQAHGVEDAPRPFFRKSDYEINVYRNQEDIFRKTCRGMYERKKARLARPLTVCACSPRVSGNFRVLREHQAHARRSLTVGEFMRDSPPQSPVRRRASPRSTPAATPHSRSVSPRDRDDVLPRIVGARGRSARGPGPGEEPAPRVRRGNGAGPRAFSRRRAPRGSRPRARMGSGEREAARERRLAERRRGGAGVARGRRRSPRTPRSPRSPRSPRDGAALCASPRSSRSRSPSPRTPRRRRSGSVDAFPGAAFDDGAGARDPSTGRVRDIFDVHDRVIDAASRATTARRQRGVRAPPPPPRFSRRAGEPPCSVAQIVRAPAERRRNTWRAGAKPRISATLLRQLQTIGLTPRNVAPGARDPGAALTRADDAGGGRSRRASDGHAEGGTPYQRYRKSAAGESDPGLDFDFDWDLDEDEDEGNPRPGGAHFPALPSARETAEDRGVSRAGRARSLSRSGRRGPIRRARGTRSPTPERDGEFGEFGDVAATRADEPVYGTHTYTFERVNPHRLPRAAGGPPRAAAAARAPAAAGERGGVPGKPARRRWSGRRAGAGGGSDDARAGDARAGGARAGGPSRAGPARGADHGRGGFRRIGARASPKRRKRAVRGSCRSSGEHKTTEERAIESALGLTMSGTKFVAARPAVGNGAPAAPVEPTPPGTPPSPQRRRIRKRLKLKISL